MALPLIAGAVGRIVARRVGGGLVRRAGGAILRRGAAAVGGIAGARVTRGILRPGRGRRRGIPSLSANEMGKLMFMAQILGRRSPAMTMIVMKALGGRI